MMFGGQDQTTSTQVTIPKDVSYCFSYHQTHKQHITSMLTHYVNQSQATLFLMLGFRPYIAEYTVANFGHCPIRPCILNIVFALFILSLDT